MWFENYRAVDHLAEAWLSYGYLVRSVSLSLDCRNLNPRDLLASSRDIYSEGPDSRLIHKDRMRMLLEHFEAKFHGACGLSGPLTSVKLDFTNCYCTSGCCRPVAEVLQMGFHDEHLMSRLSSAVLSAVGLIFEAEVEYVHDFGVHCEGCFIGGRKRDTWYCSKDPGYQFYHRCKSP